MISVPAAIRDDLLLAPWQVEPFRLWSLLDMLRFYGAAFFTVVTELEHARLMLSMAELAPSYEDVKTRVVKSVEDLQKEMARLPLPPSVRSRIERLAKIFEGELTEERTELATTLVKELQLDFQQELSQHLFLFVPAARKWMFLEPEKWFGEDVVAKFPDARIDMRDSGKSLALDQWTASVFHAMAIMEHGLRWLAGHVNIALSPIFALENWHNIIEQIESQIKAMKQLPKSQQDAGKIEFCSRAASHFFAVKDAWRNHVSHGRGKYDEAEAIKVVHNVRDFMTVLASEL